MARRCCRILTGPGTSATLPAPHKPSRNRPEMKDQDHSQARPFHWEWSEFLILSLRVQTPVRLRNFHGTHQAKEFAHQTVPIEELRQSRLNARKTLSKKFKTNPLTTIGLAIEGNFLYSWATIRKSIVRNGLIILRTPPSAVHCLYMRVLGIDCGGEYTGYGVIEMQSSG